MLARLEQLRDEAVAAIADAPGADALEALRVRYLGRKGELKALMGELPSLSADLKPAAGKLANDVKKAIEQALAGNKQKAPAPERTGPGLDITVPGVRRRLGTRHPITQVNDELVEVFARLGFETAYGPEIEDEYHNFDALNIPRDHPSRDVNGALNAGLRVALISRGSVAEPAVPPADGIPILQSLEEALPLLTTGSGQANHQSS